MPSLLSKLHEQVVSAIGNTAKPQRIGIAFSGGVDSSLLAKVCSDLGFEVILLTVGFEGSHDIEFSKKIASILKLKHVIYPITGGEFHDVASEVRGAIGTDNLSWNENCIAFHYVSKLAKKHGISMVLTANGIDELFCGYNAYREVVEEGKEAIMELMESKLANEVEMMKAVNRISSKYYVKILQPLLSAGFVEFAKSVPIKEKIRGRDDLVRKHIIRQLALSVGVPEEAALKRKKALQYGSLIHKNLLRLGKT
ncbi:MAG: asparagine synthase [Thaumarchaeota archaeon]|nr:asparagine synthase [Nitrososphaerota archaeon]